MKLYGYKLGRQKGSNQLKEVTIAANPVTLRALAEFLVTAAAGIEKYGDDFGHVHFSDRHKLAPKFPAFIVMGPIVDEVQASSEPTKSQPPQGT